MATVWVPSLMRDLTGGRETVEVAGATLGEAIAALEGAYPGVAERLCQGERIVPSITAHVDGRIALLGLLEPIGEQSEIQFLPTVAGG
jgi:molybdopterin converting factor small subunit